MIHHSEAVTAARSSDGKDACSASAALSAPERRVGRKLSGLDPTDGVYGMADEAVAVVHMPVGYFRRIRIHQAALKGNESLSGPVP